MKLLTILKDILSVLKTHAETIASKQNKAWTLIGSTSGTLSYTASNYTELDVITSFGGVNIHTTVPVSWLTSSAKYLFVGYYNGTIYIAITLTSVKVNTQPSGYTATITLYGR